jgi:hypothetical protein
MRITIRKIVYVLFKLFAIQNLILSGKYMSPYWRVLYDPMNTKHKKFSGKYITVCGQEG